MKKVASLLHLELYLFSGFRLVQKGAYFWLVLVATPCLIILAGCNPTLGLTPEPDPEQRQQALALPTGAPTPEPTPSSTRVLPLEVITPVPTISITPIPDEVLGLVVDVIDGNTLAVVLDGDPPSRAYEVRYIGVEAPENVVGEPWGVVAYEVNQQLANLKVVRLVRDETNFDEDGYLLRHVYLDDQLLSIILAERGLVRAAVAEPDLLFASEIRAAEGRAREEQLGLWGSRRPTPTISSDDRPASGAAGQTLTPAAGTATTAATGDAEPTEEPTPDVTATGTVTGTRTATSQATAEGTPESE